MIYDKKSNHKLHIFKLKKLCGLCAVHVQLLSVEIICNYNPFSINHFH